MHALSFQYLFLLREVNNSGIQKLSTFSKFQEQNVFVKQGGKCPIKGKHLQVLHFDPVQLQGHAKSPDVTL